MPFVHALNLHGSNISKAWLKHGQKNAPVAKRCGERDKKKLKKKENFRTFFSKAAFELGTKHKTRGGKSSNPW